MTGVATPARSTRNRNRNVGSSVVTVLLLAICLGCIATLVVPASRRADGAAALVLMLSLIALRVPVGIAMIGSSIAGMVSITGWTSAVNAMQTMPFRSMASWTLVVVPMFVLMGLLLERSGATKRVYDATRVWMNWLPGGLAVTTNFAGAGLAAVSGSTIAITYAVGRIAMPEMLRAGYDPRLASGAVLMAGTGGQLIPPSIMMVIYAGIAGTPIGPQLMAGLVPGVILALGYGLAIVTMARLRPSMAPRWEGEALPLRAKLLVVVRTWPIFLVVVAVVGGIFLGVLTATEAGALGAAGATVVALSFQGVKQGSRTVSRSLIETAAPTAAIMLLVIGAMLVTRLLTISGLTRSLVEFATSLGFGTFGFLVALIGLYLLLGMAIDPLTMMLLTVPILVPVFAEMDISLLWFGAFVVLLGELAVVTPPVGILSFIVHKVVSDKQVSQGLDISLGQVFAGGLWFLPIAVGVLLLMILFPEVVEWLPSVSRAR